VEPSRSAEDALSARGLLVSSFSRRALLGGLALTSLWAWGGRAGANPQDAPKVIEFSPENRRLLYERPHRRLFPKPATRAALRSATASSDLFATASSIWASFSPCSATARECPAICRTP